MVYQMQERGALAYVISLGCATTKLGFLMILSTPYIRVLLPSWGTSYTVVGQAKLLG